MMAYNGQTTGGYPQSTTPLVKASGYIESVVDVNIVPILKAQEVALSATGTGKMQSSFPFQLTKFALKVSGPCYITIDDGTEISIDETDGLVPFDDYIQKIVFKTVIDYKIVYTF